VTTVDHLETAVNAQDTHNSAPTDPATTPGAAPDALLRLDGRVAIVTGSAMGIGKAIVTRLAGAGAAVVIADTSPESEKELLASGYDALAVPCDVSSETDVAAMVATTVEWRGGVDILVNNAGVYPFAPVLTMSADAFTRIVDINLKGVFLCSREAAARMVKQGRGGRIINITSVDAVHPSSIGLAAYDASKHGVWGFTKNLALELAPHRIWVNAIAPGAIATPGVEHANAAAGVDPQDVVKAFVSRIPMQRIGDPDDIGKVALFLASDLATYQTGSQIVVDGGVLLS